MWFGFHKRVETTFTQKSVYLEILGRKVHFLNTMCVCWLDGGNCGTFKIFVTPLLYFPVTVAAVIVVRRRCQNDRCCCLIYRATKSKNQLNKISHIIQSEGEMLFLYFWEASVWTWSLLSDFSPPLCHFWYVCGRRPYFLNFAVRTTAAWRNKGANCSHPNSSMGVFATSYYKRYVLCELDAEMEQIDVTNDER